MTLIDLLTKYADEYDIVVNGYARPFSALQFSRSSMTVYLPVVDGENIYNQTVVTGDGGILKFHGLDLKKKNTGESLRVDKVVFNDEGHVQQSVTLEALASAMNVYEVNCSLQSVRKVLFNREPSNLKWSGGNKDYSQNYVVVPRCEYKPLSKNQAVMLLNAISSGKFDRLSDMQLRTLTFMKEHPEVLQEGWEDAANLPLYIYKSVSLIYLYRVSCMFSKTVEYPVMVSDTFWIVEENVDMKPGRVKPTNIF